MARTYIQTSWNDADKFAYNGAQQHFKPNGAANPKAYEEKPVEKATKTKKVKAPDYRTLDQKREDSLDKKRVQFEKAFEEGTISFDQYEALLTEWTKSRARLDRRMGIVEEVTNDLTPIAKSSIINALENAANSFRVNHPSAFTIVGCLFGCGLLNLVGFRG